MKHLLLIIAITALALTACGPAAEPTMDPANVQGTAMAAAMTMVAETQAAIPAPTQIPPTPMPSVTPIPTNTVAPFTLASPTLPAGVLPVNTPIPTTASNASGDPCNHPLTAWDGESANMTLVNNAKPSLVTLWLYFTTPMGQCGYISAQFNNSTTLSVPMGTFSTGAFVEGKKDFKVFGGGTITRTGNYSLWVEKNSIILKAGCAPNC